MKRLIFALVALLFTSYAALAQAEKTDGGKNMTAAQRTERQVNRMNSELTLNSAQREQVMVLLTQQNEKLDEIRKAEGANKQAMREKMNTVKTEGDKALKGILTAEQWEKYEGLQAERKARRAEHGKDAAGK